MRTGQSLPWGIGPARLRAGEVRKILARTGGIVALTLAVAACGTSTTVPGAPLNVSALLMGTNAVVVWSPPLSNGGSAITQYIVIPSTGTQVTVPGNAIRATVSGITPGTSVTFTVEAQNANGTGAASKPSAPAAS